MLDMASVEKGSFKNRHAKITNVYLHIRLSMLPIMTLYVLTSCEVKPNYFLPLFHHVSIEKL